MSASSDIASLFKLFGGRADLYQEIPCDNDGSASLPYRPVAAVTEPVVSPVAQQAEVAREPMPEPVQDSAQGDAAGEAEALSAWSAAGLQHLLSQLGQQPHAHMAGAAELSNAVPRLEHIRILAVVSAKGGVGKSTLAANLAAALQRAGRSVLALDLDPQNALHHHFLSADEQLLHGQRGIAPCEQGWREQCIASAEGVLLLPHGQLDESRRPAFEAQLRADPLWLARRLSDLQLEPGALVIIDTPPGPSVYLQQALSVANLALVVSLADAASYTTLPMIDGLIKTHTAECKSFAGTTYLINQVDVSRQLNSDIAKIMQGLLGHKVVGTVHRDQSITEALAYNRNVLDYDPQGRGCHDILDCAKALLERLINVSRVELPA